MNMLRRAALALTMLALLQAPAAVLAEDAAKLEASPATMAAPAPLDDIPAMGEQMQDMMPSQGMGPGGKCNKRPGHGPGMMMQGDGMGKGPGSGPGMDMMAKGKHCDPDGKARHCDHPRMCQGGCQCPGMMGKGGHHGAQHSCPRAEALEERIDDLEQRLDMMQMMLKMMMR